MAGGTVKNCARKAKLIRDNASCSSYKYLKSLSTNRRFITSTVHYFKHALCWLFNTSNVHYVDRFYILSCVTTNVCLLDSSVPRTRITLHLSLFTFVLNARLKRLKITYLWAVNHTLLYKTLNRYKLLVCHIILKLSFNSLKFMVIIRSEDICMNVF